MFCKRDWSPCRERSRLQVLDRGPMTSGVSGACWLMRPRKGDWRWPQSSSALGYTYKGDFARTGRVAVMGTPKSAALLAFLNVSISFPVKYPERALRLCFSSGATTCKISMEGLGKMLRRTPQSSLSSREERLRGGPQKEFFGSQDPSRGEGEGCGWSSSSEVKALRSLLEEFNLGPAQRSLRDIGTGLRSKLGQARERTTGYSWRLALTLEPKWIMGKKNHNVHINQRPAP
nr:uncharacterized protein LOC129467832 [Symphalangus syndactylus]